MLSRLFSCITRAWHPEKQRSCSCVGFRRSSLSFFHSLWFLFEIFRSFVIHTLTAVVKCPTTTVKECRCYFVSLLPFAFAALHYYSFVWCKLEVKNASSLRFFYNANSKSDYRTSLPASFSEKYNITPERPHSSSPVEGIVIEAARQLPLYFSRFFVVKVSHKGALRSRLCATLLPMFWENVGNTRVPTASPWRTWPYWEHSNIAVCISRDRMSCQMYISLLSPSTAWN